MSSPITLLPSFDGFQSPLQSKFDTDYNPSPAEKHTAKEIIGGVERELAELHAKQLRLEKILEDHKRFVTLMRLLPFEIMVHIFADCLDSHDARSGVDVKHFPLWSLSHVCRSWREVILASPKLWTTVRLFDHDHNPIPILQLFLERSQDLPLDVYVLPGSANLMPHVRTIPNPHNWHINTEKEINEIVDTLVSHAHRWRDLHWLSSRYPLSLRMHTTGNELSHLRFIYATLPRAFHDDDIILPPLSSNNPSRSHDAANATFGTGAFLHAPRLKEFLVSGAPSLNQLSANIPWSQLTTLRLSLMGIRLADLFGLLSQVPSLIHLSLSLPIPPSVDGSAVIKVMLPHLETLTLLLPMSHHGEVQMSFLLGSLDAPALQRLSTDKIQTQDLDALHNFAERSPMITKMFIGIATFSPEQLVPTLQRLDRLEDLALFFNGYHDEQLDLDQPLDALVVPSPRDASRLLHRLKATEGHLLLLPRLKKLTLSMVSISEPYDLCGFLAIRASPYCVVARLEKFHCFNSPALTQDSAVLNEVDRIIKETNLNFHWSCGHSHARRPRLIEFGAGFDDPFDASPLDDDVLPREQPPQSSDDPMTVQWLPSLPPMFGNLTMAMGNPMLFPEPFEFPSPEDQDL